mmetsp:Transcript_5202/g.15018  ORF Transcript_5202/g.15018 Transcript_5202/m.15018 type:complete len:327 (+) Transcript_5202:436-1416(+)
MNELETYVPSCYNDEIPPNEEIQGLNRFADDLRPFSQVLDRTTHEDHRNFPRGHIPEALRDLLSFLLLRWSNDPRLPRPEPNVQSDRLPHRPVEEERPEQPARDAHERVPVHGDDGNELSRAHHDEGRGEGEDGPRDERLDRLVQGEDPAEAVLPNERADRLAEEGFDHAQLEADAEQAAGDEGAVLAEGLGADHRLGRTLQEAVEIVGRRADRLEIFGVEVGGELRGDGDGRGGDGVVGVDGQQREGGKGGEPTSVRRHAGAISSSTTLPCSPPPLVDGIPRPVRRLAEWIEPSVRNTRDVDGLLVQSEHPTPGPPRRGSCGCRW